MQSPTASSLPERPPYATSIGTAAIHQVWCDQNGRSSLLMALEMTILSRLWLTPRLLKVLITMCQVAEALKLSAAKRAIRRTVRRQHRTTDRALKTKRALGD